MLTEAEVIGEVDTSSIQPHHRQPQGKPKAKAAKPGSEESTRSEVQHLQGEKKAEGAASSASSDPSSSSSPPPPPPSPLPLCLTASTSPTSRPCASPYGPRGLDYYRSAADDEITMRENRAAFHRVFLLPRVLVDVKAIDLRTRLLGRASALPPLHLRMRPRQAGAPRRRVRPGARGRQGRHRADVPDAGQLLHRGDGGRAAQRPLGNPVVPAVRQLQQGHDPVPHPPGGDMRA